jgi:hypothetical protein
LTQRLEVLDEKLRELEREVARQKTSSGVVRSRYEQLLSDSKEREAKLQSQILDLTSKLAGLEEKARMLEKLSDRGWQVWIAIFGAGLALLISLLKH